MNDELRADTKSQRKRERRVMMSSARPSAKCCCSTSWLRFSNGRTASDGAASDRRAFVARREAFHFPAKR